MWGDSGALRALASRVDGMGDDVVLRRRVLLDGQQVQWHSTAADRFRQQLADRLASVERSGAEVDEVARGRVWTGADALKRGLVDELGGLRRALDLARDRAGLAADAPVRTFPHAPLLRQLRRPQSSEDLGAAAQALLPEVRGGVGDLLGALGGGGELLMPPVRL